MQELPFLHSAHRLMLIDICMKFREDSFRGFQATERTRFVTDRQTHGQTDGRTSGRPRKNNMSPNPSGGDINIPNETEKIVNFLFSNYKSMGTISCYSNQSSHPPGIKNTTFVDFVLF